ncbi:MAG: hypothetical protein OEY14_18225, partial [Myxococcales bacterium]|nr:hypothetical protein [Myxococcales bacterium]
MRRAAHEIYDQFLRQLVFAPASSSSAGELWRELMLPTRGVFPGPVLISNARWLRMFGSDLPDEGHEELEPCTLSKLGFEEQARSLGRYCAVNDGVRELDFEALAECLDSRLRASLVHWVVSVYLASPGNLADARTAGYQARAAREFVARYGRNTRELAGSTMFVNMPYFLSYRAGIEPVELAPILNGQLTRRMVEKFGTHADDPSGGRLRAELVRGGNVILCPNWRDEHVAYRCMSTALEALRGDDTRVVMAFEPGMTAVPARAWEAETLRVTMPGKAHFVQEAGAIADQLEAAELDFLMYPEVTPNNATACLATRRLARVQAAGYGFPVTTGSPHMDYFVGGTEVEADGTEYTEQLILLPGLGVSTTAPPL